jgi:hypothetical protein
MTARFQLDISRKHLEELESLMRELGISTKKDLFNQAITLLEWAATERKNGRIIASIDEAKDEYKQVALPVLERLAPRAPAETPARDLIKST